MPSLVPSSLQDCAAVMIWVTMLEECSCAVGSCMGNLYSLLMMPRGCCGAEHVTMTSAGGEVTT